MRHPFLRLFQILACSSLTALAALARPAPPPPERPLWVSVLGESERPDGSWAGVDLLAGMPAEVDRFQVTLRPERAVRVRLEAITAQGVERLYPSHPGDARLEPGRAWALPGPRAFYEVKGQARLRLVVTPTEGTPTSGDGILRAQSEHHRVTYPLSDGAPFPVAERGFVGAGGGALEVSLAGR